MSLSGVGFTLGLSIPLVIAGCSDDDKKNDEEGTGGSGGAAGSGTGGSGASTGGAAASGGSGGGPSSGGSGGGGTGGASGSGGSQASGGTGGMAGAAGESGAAGAGGVPEPPECENEQSEPGEVCFADAVATNIGEGGPPFYLSIAQWDGQGGQDIVTSTTGSGVWYIDANGDGHWTGVGGDAIIVGSFDDGPDPDILAHNGSSYSLYFGDGDGDVATTEGLSIGEGNALELVVVDLPGSAPSDDALVVDNCVGVVATTGTEGEEYLDAADDARCSRGATDAVLLGLGPDATAIGWANGGDGVLTLTSVSYSPGAVTLGDEGDDVDVDLDGTPLNLAAADFDGDGFDDVVATLEGLASINVLLSDGEGGLEPPEALTLGESAAAETARDVQIGDFDADGHPDIAVSVEGLDSVAIFLGDGAGGFDSAVLVPTGDGSGPGRIAVGRLNGDANDDLAIAGADTVLRLLSTP